MAESELAGRLAPLVEAAGLELYDAEVGRGVVRVTVTKQGGVDLDALSALNAPISAWLDEHDPMPGKYTLEVSSPGLERPLRTPAHFKGAIGELVTLRVVKDGSPALRVHGTLRAADATGIELESASGEVVTARYGEMERARTVFEWGAAEKPKSPSKAGRTRAAAERGA